MAMRIRTVWKTEKPKRRKGQVQELKKKRGKKIENRKGGNSNKKQQAILGEQRGKYQVDWPVRGEQPGKTVATTSNSLKVCYKINTAQVKQAPVAIRG